MQLFIFNDHFVSGFERRASAFVRDVEFPVEVCWACFDDLQLACGCCSGNLSTAIFECICQLEHGDLQLLTNNAESTFTAIQIRYRKIGNLSWWLETTLSLEHICLHLSPLIISLILPSFSSSFASRRVSSLNQTPDLVSTIPTREPFFVLSSCFRRLVAGLIDISQFSSQVSKSWCTWWIRS